MNMFWLGGYHIGFIENNKVPSFPYRRLKKKKKIENIHLKTDDNYIKF